MSTNAPIHPEPRQQVCFNAKLRTRYTRERLEMTIVSGMRRISPSDYSRQGGVVVLALLLVVFSASSFVVLKALNANTLRQAKVDMTTKQALMEAKSALMGYAIGWHVADPSNPPALGKGPGHLPCPDHDAAGTPGSSDAVPSCTLASSNETGRFPWRTLGMHELLDGSGSPLWYAVSDNHRVTANPPLNSDTAGTLQVDNATDVVAVIIAPGTALDGQYRTTSNDYSASEFLEGGNASIGDNAFVSIATGDFNDAVVYITRGELMTAVERTVLNEVANALDNYFDDPDADDDSFGNDPDCDDGYPWLSDFANPGTSSYMGAVDDFGGGELAFGHLPLVRWAQPVTGNADFTTDWTVATGGTFTPTGAEPPEESSVRRTDDTESFDLFPFCPGLVVADHTFPANITGALGGPWSQGTCQLSKEIIDTASYQVVNCVATYDFTVENVEYPPWVFDRDIRRVYELEFRNNLRTLAAPSATARRTFGMQETGSWSGAQSTITVTDTDVTYGGEMGSATFTFDTLNTGDNLNIAAVPFDLEVSDDSTVDHNTSPGELPNWFVANNWHQHVLVQYAQAESPGDVDLTCVDDTTCLTLNVTRPDAGTPVTDTAVRGVVVSAGSDLAGNRPTATLNDYLEGNNATVDVTFDKQQVTTVFNDQLVTIPLQR